MLVSKSEVDFSSLDIQFQLKNVKEDIYSFYNSNGDCIKFGLNNSEKYFFIDRLKSGNISFSEKFAPAISKALFKEKLKNVEVHVLLDKTSIELFINNGKIVITEIFFPHKPFEAFSIKSEKYTTEIENIIINQLKMTELK